MREKVQFLQARFTKKFESQETQTVEELEPELGEDDDEWIEDESNKSSKCDSENDYMSMTNELLLQTHMKR